MVHVSIVGDVHANVGWGIQYLRATQCLAGEGVREGDYLASYYET
jgi:hypothetical protein